MNRKTKHLITGVSVCFVFFFILAALNRSGSFILFWKEESLQKTHHDAGYGYFSYISENNIAKLNLPFFVLEDGKPLPFNPLSVNEDITATIKLQGGGLYHLQENSDLYFSASDNHPENHEYRILSPVIIRTRYLALFFIPAAISVLFALFLCIRKKDDSILRTLFTGALFLCLILMLLPWNNFAFFTSPASFGNYLIKPILQRNTLFLCLLFALLIFNVFFSGKKKILPILSALILISNTVYYFLPEWNYFGFRADSPAYLEHYTASSIRTPGYPVFIEGVYALTGNNELEELRYTQIEVVSEDIQDGTLGESHGLINVVRAQKIILGMIFILLYAIFSKYYPTLWFLFAAQIILPQGFLGVDNSYIMTECLSQAVLLLCAALFILVMKKRNLISFFLLCVVAAYGILIRPANIFLVIPIAIGLIILISSHQKKLLICAGLVVFVILCAIPALTIYSQYHVFVWMPTSGYVEIARAVELLQPGDETAFSDPEQQVFVSELLAKKAEIGNADQNTYMWDVGIATAGELGYDLITCSTIFGPVSRKTFLLHSKELVATLAKTLNAVLERTKLQTGLVSFPLISMVFLLMAAWCFNEDSLLGMVLALMHTTHLFIFIMNQPERRYIYSTEILCLIGWLIIFVSFLTKIKALFRGRFTRRETVPKP